jgi:hypothetical protein
VVLAMPTNLTGARAGLTATAAMSTLLAGRWLVQPKVAPPPQVVAENAFRRLGLEPSRLPRAVRHLLWPAAHAGFGATLGAVYGSLGGSGDAKHGVAYGLGCWAANYGVGLPLAGLYPRLDRDVPPRAVSSLLSHVVFGWALATAWPSRPARR